MLRLPKEIFNKSGVNVDEKIVERRVAKEFGISEEERNKIYIKVTAYKMK